jgi:hypothetical protein
VQQRRQIVDGLRKAILNDALGFDYEVEDAIVLLLSFNRCGFHIVSCSLSLDVVSHFSTLKVMLT